jgi:hypothetical protein
MKLKLEILLGILLSFGLLSFIALDSNAFFERERVYTYELKDGDSLVIISSFTNCFNDSRFTLKILMESNEIHASFIESGNSEVITKTLPLDFKKDLIEFELMTDPNLKYGVGSSCMMMFKLNNEPFDTIRKCPQVKYYDNLIEKIKN